MLQSSCRGKYEHRSQITSIYKNESEIKGKKLNAEGFGRDRDKEKMFLAKDFIYLSFKMF